MSKNPLKEKSYQFAVKIVKLTKEIASSQKEFVQTRQVLRAGAAIGAFVREAEYAQSKKDFI